MGLKLIIAYFILFKLFIKILFLSFISYIGLYTFYIIAIYFLSYIIIHLKNPVYSLLSFLFLVVSSSVVFLLYFRKLEFLGLSIIIVYGGAILILLL